MRCLIPFRSGLLAGLCLSFLISSCKARDVSTTKDVNMTVMKDGSFVTETDWYNFFPTQQNQAIRAALDAAVKSIEDRFPGVNVRQQVFENLGDIDFSHAVRLSQAILDSEINVPKGLKGLSLGGLIPKGFVILVGGGPFDDLQVKKFDVSATAMFTFIPRLYYRKLPGDKHVRAYFKMKIGLSMLAVTELGAEQMAQITQKVLTQAVAARGLESMASMPAKPLKVGVGMIFGDFTDPNQLSTSLWGGRAEFSINRWTGRLAALNGGWRAQFLVLNKDIWNVAPRGMIISLEKQIGAANSEAGIILGGNVSLDTFARFLKSFYHAATSSANEGDSEVDKNEVKTMEFEADTMPTDGESAEPKTGASGFEQDFNEQ